MDEKPITRKTIPDEEAIGKAIIEALKSGRPRSSSAVEKEVATALGLSRAEKAYKIGHSSTALFENRFKKSQSELYGRGLIDRPSLGKLKLTEAGLAYLEAAGEKERHAEEPAKKKPESASDIGPSTPYRVADREPAKGRQAAEDSPGNTPFSFVELPKADRQTRKTPPMLPLVLALVAIVLCCIKPLAPLGVLCSIASIALFLLSKNTQIDIKAPKASIALSVLSLFLGVSVAFGAGSPPAAPDSSNPSTTVAESPQRAEQSGAAEKEEAAVLSFSVSASEWESGKTVPVLITCTEGASKGLSELHDAKPGKVYELDFQDGSYTFAIDAAALSDDATIYASDPVSYVFDLKKSHTVKLSLKKDTEAMARIQDEKEAAEKQAAEEAAAAEAAAEAEAKAAAEAEAAAAAAAASAPDNGGYTVYITETGEKYHADGCRYLKKSKIPISKSDAIARGYGACSRCNP